MCAQAQRILFQRLERDERMIDAHIHHEFQGKTKAEDQAELDQLRRLLNGQGIRQAVLYMIYENDISQKRYELDFGESIIPACLLDPRTPLETLGKQLQMLRENGVRILKLHPYRQQLLRSDYEQVSQFAKLVQDAGMILAICGSYGSKDVYNTNGVEMAAYILERGFTNPLIVAHGGMAKQLDTYSLMRECDNLYIDISFTIPYWKGSTVIQDLAFVLERMSYQRCFYGSDYPYVSFQESLQAFHWFCDEYHIEGRNRDMLLDLNFKQFAAAYLGNNQ